MDLTSLRMLLTPLGHQALSDAAALSPKESTFLHDMTVLSRRYPADLARAALETAIFRAEAVAKYPSADKMYFTRQALEQASGFEVSNYRARRFRGFERVYDLGCSIGSDTLAIAAETCTIGVDIDPLRLAMAQLNALILDHRCAVDFLLADLTAPLPFVLSPKQAIFFDPARRNEGRRVHSVHGYHPPLNVIDGWGKQVPAIGVKISPGVNLAEIQFYDAEIEFISVRGELKEAVLWFGPLKTAHRRATLLPGEHTMMIERTFEETQNPNISGEMPARISDPQSYLFEPDPAILRAGLVRKLGAQIGAAQLDPDIAYLTADHFVEIPFARGYRIEEWLPFNMKHLRLLLHNKGVKRATVKKRGSPIPPEKLLHDLNLLPGSGNAPDECVIVMTHLRGKPIAIICSPIQGTAKHN